MSESPEGGKGSDPATTLRGYSTGDERPRSEDEATIPDDRPPTRRGGTPVVEIEVVHEVGPAPRDVERRRTVEVWTQNRVYTLDATMTCIEVTDRISRDPVSDHPFLGTRLVGGQAREGEVIELSYPFPRPGTEAVFEQSEGRRAGFSRTSPVTRVVLRLHLVTVSPSHVVPTWEEIRGLLHVDGEPK
jgi:hypothetical protein